MSRAAVVVFVLGGALLACRRQVRETPAVTAPVAQAAPSAAVGVADADTVEAPSTVPAAAPVPAAVEVIDTPEAPETLVGEERDRDPRSQTVTIKLIADPRRKARVFWGRKDLGLAPLEITRPRNSGPLDLVVTAPGCLTLHTRAFTDRDDKIALRLYAESEAPSVFGYRPDDKPRTP